MLMMEAYAIQKNLGVHKKEVRFIRRNRKKKSADDIIDMLEVTKQDYESVITVLDSHPDWDDERIAEEIDWTE